MTDSRCAVVTGASAGIGLETARLLLESGWKVVGLGRNPERSAEALETLRRAVPSGDVQMVVADLASLPAARVAGQQILAHAGRIDVLLNNAGGLTAEFKLTSEGHENTFASNHLGPFLLTKALLPRLLDTASENPAGVSRIINTSSEAHEYAGDIDWDDLQYKTDFVSGKAYCRVKLLNILFTRELARRFGASNIISHAFHPGVVASNFFSYADTEMAKSKEYFEARAIPPSQAAADLLWLATHADPAQVNGRYFHDYTEREPNAIALDDAAALKLWALSEELVADYLAAD